MSFIFIALAYRAGEQLSFHFTFLSCLEVKRPKYTAALGVVSVLCRARSHACLCLSLIGADVGACSQPGGDNQGRLQRATPTLLQLPVSGHWL